MISKQTRGALKKIRRVQFINSPVRSMLKTSLKTLPGKLSDFMLPRWSVAGTLHFKVGDVDFDFYCDGDDGIARDLYYDQQTYSEINETRLYAALARISGCILDVGANTGLHTVLAASANRQAQVFSFEPHQANFNRLKQNLLVNRAENVEIVEKAVGDKVGKLLFTVPLNDQISDLCSVDGDFTRLNDQTYNHGRTYEDVEVEATTLDDFVLHERELPGVDLLKIDVENYEQPVLRGARQLLERFSPVVLCEINVDPERQALYRDLLQPLGYYCYLMTPTGLVRTESLEPNPDARNFFLAKAKTPQVYTSFHDGMDKVAASLRGV